MESDLYVDTIELYLRKIPRGYRKRLEAIVGKRVRISSCLNGDGKPSGFRVALNRPSQWALRFADKTINDGAALLIRADIAFDLFVERHLQASVLAAARKYFVLRYRRKGPLSAVGSTLYFSGAISNAHGKDTRSSRNLVIYPSLERGSDQGRLTVHIELRLWGTRALKRAGVSSARFLLSKANLGRALESQVNLVDLDIETRVEDFIRRAVREERELFLAKKPRKEYPLLDLYRSRISHRTRSILVKAGLDTAQILKDSHPQTLRGVEKLAFNKWGLHLLKKAHQVWPSRNNLTDHVA